MSDDGIPQTYPGLAGLSLMRRDELEFLAATLPPGCSFLEIGTSEGATAAELARRRPDLRVTCLDTYAYEPARVLAWLANRRPNMTLFVGSALELADACRGAFDAALVDGDHHHASVSADLVAAALLVKRGGLILAHDYLDPNWPGVASAVELWAATTGWRPTRGVAHLYLLERR